MEVVSPEELVSTDHLLRKIARVMALSICDKSNVYCAENCRPLVDSRVFVKVWVGGQRWRFSLLPAHHLAIFVEYGAARLNCQTS